MSRFSFLQDVLASVFDRNTGNKLQTDDRPMLDLCDALLSSRGEVSGTYLAEAILQRAESAAEGAGSADSDGENELISFFDLLLARYDINDREALQAVTAYADDRTATNWRALIKATVSRRQVLLRRINRAPGSTRRLVALRQKLLEVLPAHPQFARVDVDFEHLFQAWFNRGFLVLRQIDWDTPASILEKIIDYEAVHAINDWADLRRRLEPSDRRCFAFFHPSMPDDPLIFVEVALTKSLPESIQSVLTPSRDTLSLNDVDTALFYSISNCQSGLKGVSFGNFLIKQVANELAAEYPNLSDFRTLSPMPGLVGWLQAASDISEDQVDAREHALRLADSVEAEQTRETTSSLLAMTPAEQLQLRQLGAHYLIRERREDNQPRDPVARFHLGNGAALSEIVCGADLSPKGLRQSAGLMVSYRYDLDAVEANHEAYAQNRLITTTSEVEGLVGRGEKNTRQQATG